MAYLPNYEWDVFISYANADNGSFRFNKWMTAFYKALKAEVEKNLIGELKVFFDNRSLTSSGTLQDILTAVGNSGIILVIGSPNWVKSEDWCQKELNTFLQKNRADLSRVFVAEFEPPAGEIRYPEVIAAKPQRRFWKASENEELPTPLGHRDKLFDERLRLIGKEVRERLMQLRKSVSEVAKPGPYAGRRVFVGPAMPGVAVERASLVNYLSGLGVTICEPPASGAANGAALDGAEVLVQALGERETAAPESADAAGVVALVAAADGRHLPVFLWRPERIEPDQVEKGPYQSLLLRARIDSIVPTVATAVLDKLEDIQKQIEKPPEEEDGPIKLVVSADPEDDERARELIGACRNRRCKVILDDFDLGDAVRAQWADAAAVAFVHGNAHRHWLAARYSAFDQARSNQKVTGDLKGQAVVYAPPPPKKTGTIGGSGLDEIDVSQSWSIEPFKDWLDKIGARELKPK